MAVDLGLTPRNGQFNGVVGELMQDLAQRRKGYEPLPSVDADMRAVGLTQGMVDQAFSAAAQSHTREPMDGHVREVGTPSGVSPNSPGSGQGIIFESYGGPE